jgi:hypothetical protein
MPFKREINAMTKLFTRWSITTAALVALSSVVVAQPADADTPAAAHPLTAGAAIINLYDWRCLDENLGEGGVHNGSKAQVWGCNGWSNQGWTYYSDGTIRSSYDGRCLDENLGGGSFNGQKVQLWDCNGWDNQHWTIYTNGQIINQHDGRCLDENLGGGSFDGQKVQVWDCNGWDNQRWIHP